MNHTPEPAHIKKKNIERTLEVREMKTQHLWWEVLDLFLLQNKALVPFLSFIAVVVIVLYLYRPSWSVLNVPGPTAMPLVGHLPMLAKYGPDLFSVLAKHYGPLFRSTSLSPSLLIHSCYGCFPPKLRP